MLLNNTTNGLIPVSVRIDNRLVVASGFVLLDVDCVLSIELGDLKLEVLFADDEGVELGVEPEQVDPKKLRLRLRNFKNMFGSAFGPVAIGSIGQAQIWMALHVTAVGDRLRATAYSLSLA